MRTSNRQLTGKILAALLFIPTLGLIFGSIATRAKSGFAVPQATIQRNDARARESFLGVIPVLKHPRCLNCHSTGDYPRQGDDGHIHTQNVKRGIDGNGKYGEHCSACHQDRNVAGLNMPPGAPDWRLPPAPTPMIWEGRTPGQICNQIKDPKQNNEKSIAQIVEHVTSDKLVMWGWNPGEGRTIPPLSHDEFAQKFRDWAHYGAACPE